MAAGQGEADRLHTLMSQMAPSTVPPSRPAVVPTIGASTARSDSAARGLVSAERDAAMLSASRRLVNDSLDAALAKVKMTPRETSPLTSSRLLSPTPSSRLPSVNLSSRKLAPAAADPTAGSGWLLAPDADAYCSGPRAASSEPVFDPAQPPAPAPPRVAAAASPVPAAADAVAEGKTETAAAAAAAEAAEAAEVADERIRSPSSPSLSSPSLPSPSPVVLPRPHPSLGLDAVDEAFLRHRPLEGGSLMAVTVR